MINFTGAIPLRTTHITEPEYALIDEEIISPTKRSSSASVEAGYEIPCPSTLPTTRLPTHHDDNDYMNVQLHHEPDYEDLAASSRAPTVESKYETLSFSRMVNQNNTKTKKERLPKLGCRKNQKMSVRK